MHCCRRFEILQKKAVDEFLAMLVPHTQIMPLA